APVVGTEAGRTTPGTGCGDGAARAAWSGAIACAPTASPPAFSITMSWARRAPGVPSGCAGGLPLLGVLTMIIASQGVRHVRDPGAELVAHHGLRGAVVGVDHTVLLAVAAVVAVKAHPVAALGLEAPLALGPVLEIIGIDHRGRRVDQVVVPERAPVDRL